MLSDRCNSSILFSTVYGRLLPNNYILHVLYTSVLETETQFMVKYLN